MQIRVKAMVDMAAAPDSNYVLELDPGQKIKP